MKLFLLIVLSFLFIHGISGQVESGFLNLNYGKDEVFDPKDLNIDDAFTISFIDKPENLKIDELLSTYSIEVKTDLAVIKMEKTTLKDMYMAKNISEENVLNELNTKSKLNLNLIIGDLKATDIIYFHIDHKNVLENKIIKIKVSGIDEMPKNGIKNNDAEHNDINIGKLKKKNTEIKEDNNSTKKQKNAFGDYFDPDNCKDCKMYNGNLVYDFRCKKLYKYNKNNEKHELVNNLGDIHIKSKEMLEFKIININRYLYSIETSVEDSLYISNPPPLFNDFFSPTSDLYTKLRQGSESTSKNNDTLIINLMTKINKYIVLENDLIIRQLDPFLYCKDISYSCCGGDTLKPYSTYLKALQEAKNQIIDYESKHFALYPTAEVLRAEIIEGKKKLDSCIVKRKVNESKKSKLKTKIEDLEKEKTPKKEDLEKEKTPENLKKIDSLKTEIIKLDDDINSDCSDTLVTMTRYRVNKLDSILPSKILIDTLKKVLPSEADLRKMYLFAANVHKDHFEFKLPPIYPDGHKLKISLLISPRDTSKKTEITYMPLYSEKVNFDFIVKNKMLFSFSSGPFFAFGRNLSVPSYGFKQIPASGTVIGADARNRLDATGDGPLPVGLGAYANIGRKVYKNFGLAGTIGVGYTFNQDTPLPGFMGGLTASFGEDQRINLTAGATFIQVRELKKDLYLGNVYETIPTLEYNKPMRMGFFLSVSYSIFTSAVSKSTSSKSK